MMRAASALVVLLAATGLGLGGCQKQLEAPADAGVCWHMVSPAKGQYRFNKVAQNVPNLETCAANLEALRIKFLQMGGSHRDLTGAYQGKFIFLEQEGIFVGDTLNGAAYIALVRTNDGRLVVPGAARSS